MTSVIIEDKGGAKMKVGVDVGDGFITPDPKGAPEEVKQVFDMLPEFKFRPDDILLCTYQKTGTHWLFEILSMINNRKAELTQMTKGRCMLEIVPQSAINQLPSPRVLNSHYPPRLLPKDKALSKTILCVRNPKDTAVSFYNHMKGFRTYEYDGKFSDWLPIFLAGKMEYGKYTDYLLEWEKVITKGKDFPIHLMYYEDLKLDGEAELERLLNFLDIELDKQLQKDILNACGFDKMASDKFQGPKHIVDKMFRENFRFFRKGEIGDWKNWFTCADNEMFDETWTKEMANSKLFEFKYTGPRS